MANLAHLMFDIDGTLVASFDFDEQCYMEAIHEVFGEALNNNWSEYPHITDSGILQHFLEQHNRTEPLSTSIDLVKRSFVDRVQAHIKKHPIKSIDGALEFFNSVQQNCSISIATGGWRETAELKLHSAGFDIANVALASSNDHYARINIMQHSLALSGITDYQSVTYFGDGEWDKTACEILGINFVAVGARVKHHQQIDNFTDIDKVLRFIR